MSCLTIQQLPSSPYMWIHVIRKIMVYHHRIRNSLQKSKPGQSISLIDPGGRIPDVMSCEYDCKGENIDNSGARQSPFFTVWEIRCWDSPQQKNQFFFIPHTPSIFQHRLPEHFQSTTSPAPPKPIKPFASLHSLPQILPPKFNIDTCRLKWKFSSLAAPCWCQR